MMSALPGSRALLDGHRTASSAASITRQWSAADYQRLHDELERELADLPAVIDYVIRGLRHASTDVAAAYAEFHARRGNVAPLAELKRRRQVRSVRDQLAAAVELGQRERAEILRRLARRKPWSRTDLDSSRWRDSEHPSPNVPAHRRFRRHDAYFAGGPVPDGRPPRLRERS